MAVRKFKPTTPGQRHKIIGTFEEITASVPEKSLVYGKKSSGGRNSEGKMTMRYIGGGHRKVIRIVDFKRNKDGVPAVVKTIEYDPNRSARIALLFYADGEKRILYTTINCETLIMRVKQQRQRLVMLYFRHFRLVLLDSVSEFCASSELYAVSL